MTVYFDEKRERWRFDFWAEGKRRHGYADMPDGTPARNKTQAKRCEDLVRAALLQNKPAVLPPPNAYTLSEAIGAYAAAVKGAASWQFIRFRLEEIGTWFGPETPLIEITEDRIVAYRDWCGLQHKRIYVGGPREPDEDSKRELWKTSAQLRTPQTVNHHLNTLRAVLTRAATTKRPDGLAYLLPVAPKVVLVKQPKRLPRPIPMAAMQRILDAAPEHVAHAAELTLMFGFRRNEALGLTIDQVDFDNRGIWLDGGEVKGNRDEFIPGSPRAMELLQRLCDRAREAGQQHLVLYRPRGRNAKLRPIKAFHTAWELALARAGFSKRAWRAHDMKATYLTTLARKANTSTLQQLGRHTSASTTKVYTVVADDVARSAVDSLDDIIPRPTPKSHTGGK